MATQQQKRKLQDTMELTLENKKPHNEVEITFSDIGADSTHIDDENESILLKTSVENYGKSQEKEGDVNNESLVNTIVSACAEEENSSLSKVVESLQKIIKRKDEELMKLRNKCESLSKKVIELENSEDQRISDAGNDKIKLIKYKSTILNMNKIVKVADKEESSSENEETQNKKCDEPNASNSDTVNNISQRKTLSKKKEICRYENKGKCKLGRECKFFHPKGICQSYSKLGSCTYDYQCGLRHPTGNCHKYEKTGNCPYDERCKFGHPLEFRQNHFLGIPSKSNQDPTPPRQNVVTF